MEGIRGVTFSAILAIVFATYAHGDDELTPRRHLYSRVGETEDAEDYNKESAWYQPSAATTDISDFDSLNAEEISKRRLAKDQVRANIDLYIPTLNGSEKGLGNMLKYASRANYFIGTCISAGKDYVIAVEDTTNIDKQYWENELHSFVKLFAYALSATRGTNTLSLLKYSSTVEKVLERTLINRNNARKLGTVIDQMFSKKSSMPSAFPGQALKEMREHFYPNSHEFIGKDDTRELSVEHVAGKDTVVIIINSGSVHDSGLALEEALHARRNGVTFFSLEIDDKNSAFWKQLAGCRRGWKCLNYRSVLKPDLLNSVGMLLRNVCEPDGKDAVCLEDWSDYTACSKPCGVGIMTSTLKGFTTLLLPTNGKTGFKGRTCEAQLSNIKTKQLLCNSQPCRSPVSPIREHTNNIRATEDATHGISESNAVYHDSDGTAIDTVIDKAVDESLPVDGVQPTVTPTSIQEIEEDTSAEPVLDDTVYSSEDDTTVASGDETGTSESLDSTEDTVSPVSESETQDAKSDDSYPDVEYLDKRGNLIPDVPAPQYVYEPKPVQSGSMDTQVHHQSASSHTEHTTHGKESYNDKHSYYIKNMMQIMGGTAIFAVVCIAVSSSYVYLHKKNTPMSLVVDDAEFLNDTIGGHDESVENYEVSGANDGMWA